jgi:peptidoglycan/xylan/chitin deacetylase (PgdA/CDA1 family)
MPAPPSDFVVDEGAIRRGSSGEKKVALVFTADEHVDGAEMVLTTLQERQLPASFFLTGKALDAPDMRSWTRRALTAGHYVGPHSDGHLLYAAWDDRESSLVDKELFQADLYRNLAELRELGAATNVPVYFVPPYEWHNSTHSAWAMELGCQMINFTPGSGSHRDFAPEDHKAFRTSDELLRDILKYEDESSSGLNGHLLLLHLGTTREDKMYAKLRALTDELRANGYHFVRVDELLR